MIKNNLRLWIDRPRCLTCPRATQIEVKGLLEQWQCVYPWTTTISNMWLHMLLLLEEHELLDLKLLCLIFSPTPTMLLQALRGERSGLPKLPSSCPFPFSILVLLLQVFDGAIVIYCGWGRRRECRVGNRRREATGHGYGLSQNKWLRVIIVCVFFRKRSHGWWWKRC